MNRLISFVVSLLLGACATSATAVEYRLLDVDQVKFETWKIADNRDPYWPYNRPGSGGEEWYGGAAFQLNLTMVQIEDWSVYWDNRPYMNGTRAQVRQAGWEWDAGISWRRCASFNWHHHSTHLIDEKSEFQYPLINYFGVEITFYDRDRKCW